MNPQKVANLQMFINGHRKFKVEGYDGNLTIREFIMEFHTGELQNSPNVYEDGTYMANKRDPSRSLIDTIIACQSHFDVSIEQVLNVFQEAYVNRELRGHYCPDIDRMVLRLNYPYWSLHSAENELIDKNLPDVYFRDLFQR